MNRAALDLNLLRLFDAVYRTGSVSRAAEELDTAQPVASQGLARLRSALGDAVFERTAGGMRPTPLADRLAPTVRTCLAMLDQALAEDRVFDPSTSRRLFRLHMSDIGESRFLPMLMARLHDAAPGVRIETQWLEPGELAPALDQGRIDFAFGFLPHLSGMPHLPLLTDHYVIVVRRGHPLAACAQDPQAVAEALAALDFVAVRTHADTTRVLRLLQLEAQLRLTVEHFTALPSIVLSTDLAAVMPHAIHDLFPPDRFAVVDPRFPLEAFTVSLHWSRRFADEPANRWFRQLMADCGGEPGPA